MICKGCNTENQTGNQFCINCGQKLINDNSTDIQSQNQVQNNYNNNFQNQVAEEKTNVWLAILSWLIPLAGLIIFLTKKDKQPKTAKASGICALISFILSIVLMIITFFMLPFIIAAFTVNTLVDEAKDNVNNIEEELRESYESNIYYDEEADSIWKKYEFSVNDKKLSLPATYEDLTNATGFSFKESYLKSYLESNYYSIVNMYKNDKLALSTEVNNDSGEEALYTDCNITRISQTKYQVSQGADTIIFPGELKVGEAITEDKITQLLGSPYKINTYNNDGYNSKTYLYVEDTIWTTTNFYKITIVNGIIDELSLDNRN